MGMLLKDEVESLRKVPIFAGVAPAKLKLLAFTSDHVNYEAGQTVPNLVAVRLDPSGRVCVRAETDTHLILDVAGYFSAA